MILAQLVVPPPIPKVLDYPVTFAVGLDVIFAAVLLIAASRFDPSGGTLTISLLVVLAFIGVTTFCLFFTIPTDEATSAVIGGLTAATGAVVAYWLGRTRNDKER